MTTDNLPTETNEDPDFDWYRDLGDGFEEVETDFGTKIEWEKLPAGPTGKPMFVGSYQGLATVDAPNEETGELVPIKIHQFKDTHGELFFAWHSPRLDHGLANAAFGADVVVMWEGIEKFGKSKTMNRFRVAVRNPRHD